MGRLYKRRAAAIAFAVAVFAWPGWAADDVEKVLEAAERTQEAAAESQKKTTRLSDETRELLNEYLATLKRIESLRTYNAQLKKAIQSQEDEMASIIQQIETSRIVAREITPLMLRMLKALEAFVELDTPFLLRERRERLARLRQVMDRADVTEAEKYRRILEAYQIENDYGRTIEAYEESIERDGKNLTVNFLRLGRVALINQTLDGKHAEAWDDRSRTWKKLSARYSSAIDKGLRMARKQMAPDLITLPVPAPQ